MDMVKIVFFDSGIGGLSVLAQAKERFPQIEYIYYADKKNVPYGDKTKEDVIAYVLEAMEVIDTLKPDAVVVACNTATSVAIKTIREHYTYPIIGMEPAIKPAVSMCQNASRVLVTGTILTLQEEKIKNLLKLYDKEHVVDLLSLQKLVYFAERGQYDGDEVRGYLKEKFTHKNIEQYNVIVLGCTHFNYFRPVLQDILPKHIEIIDGSLGTIHHMIDLVGYPTKIVPNNQTIAIIESGELVQEQEKLYEYEERIHYLCSIYK